MVGTHLLPPNLLKLFAPRPPLPYLKPPGRDPDFPLKSLSSKRAPKPIVVSEVLEEVRAQQASEEADAGADASNDKDKDAAAAAPPVPKKEDSEAAPVAPVKQPKDEAAMDTLESETAPAAGEQDSTMASADDKEEGEEAMSDAAPSKTDTTTTSTTTKTTSSSQKRLTRKPKGPAAGERDDLTAETRYELRRREKKRWQQECMSKP
ncbi:hypothetical protein JCM3774_003250, partial [Rhodotorula dairenensis]